MGVRMDGGETDNRPSGEQAEASAPPGWYADPSGAEAGRPADGCYHQPCDDLRNINLDLARALAAGLADFTVQVAYAPELLTS